MENYEFSKKAAEEYSFTELALLQTLLVELQYQDTRFKAGLSTTLLPSGICTNLHVKLYPFNTGFNLAVLFFKNNTYPIRPYFTPFLTLSDQEKTQFRWGNTETGIKRSKYLAAMIKDLGDYLNTEAAKH